MLNGAKVANEWQPMSAEMCVGPMLALRELERGEHRALRAAGAEIRRARRELADGRDRRGALWPSSLSAFAEISAVSMPAGLAAARKFASPRSITSPVYSPALGSAPLPWMRVWMSARRSSALTACSM